MADERDSVWAPAATPAASTGPRGPVVDLGRPGYTDLVEVARGGDSVVYRARQTSTRRDVALKVIDVADPATLVRFERELEITVSLGRQHPHIVTVLDTFPTPDGRACLVMDFHDLGSLHDRLRAHGPLPVSEVVAAGTAVADALAFAHSHGVLHRDVKPQNVLVLPTSYVLTDFGIARRADAGHTASVERFSYRHASPQVLDGFEPTVADDVWSLGSTLSTLVHGRPPFASDDPDDDTALAYLRRVRTGAMRPQERDGVPDELVAVLRRCLEPDPAARFADADEVRRALATVPTESRAWAPGAAVGAAPPPTEQLEQPEQPREPTRPEPVPSATDDAAEPEAEPDPESGATPGPHLPATHAPSALAVGPHAPTASDGHDDRDADATATGARHLPADGPVGPDTSSDEPQPDRPRRSNRTALVSFVVGAVLVGSGIGVAASLLANQQRRTDPPPEPVVTAVPIPTVGTGPEDPDVPDPDPLDVTVSDERYAPADVVLVDRGTSIVASWTDPTDGGITVAVVDATDEAQPVPLESVAPGVTERTVEGVDPDAPRVCLMLVGIDVTDPERYGASEVTCVTR